MTRKTNRKKFGRPGDNPTAQRIMRPIEKNESLHRARKPSTTDRAEKAGEQYAYDQIQGDYFMDWVHEQMLEASKMPPDKVLPLETKDDAMEIARRMLQQLEWDTKRDLKADEIERTLGIDRATPDDIDAFYKGFRHAIAASRDWLADELLEQNRAYQERRGVVREARGRRLGARIGETKRGLNLWKRNSRTGIWEHQRAVTPETADQWLQQFQRDEPDAQFVVSKNKPSDPRPQRNRGPSLDPALIEALAADVYALSDARHISIEQAYDSITKPAWVREFESVGGDRIDLENRVINKAKSIGRARGRIGEAHRAPKARGSVRRRR
jgi:hypothetical protein